MTLFISNGKPIVEYPGTTEIACSGLGRVEFLGDGLACLVVYRNGLDHAATTLEQQVCGRIFTPLSTVPAIAELLIRAGLEAGVLAAANFSGRLLM